MKKINITKFGHYNNGMNSDEEYICKLLSKEFIVNFTTSINEVETNIIFEGHQLINHRCVINKLKKIKSKKILIITEDINGEENLNYRFFTLNNERLSFKKLILKKSIYFDLIFYHCQFLLQKLFEKQIGQIKRNLQPLFNSKKKDIYNNNFFWKERYLAFLEQLHYIDEVWFLRENNLKFYRKICEDYKIKTKIIYYKVMQLSISKTEKKYDFLITGTLNKYRENILNFLNKNFNVKYEKFLSLDDLKKTLMQSRYHLILNKSPIGLFPSSSRMKIALENDCLPINDKTIFNDHLNNYSLSNDDWFNKKKIDFFLSNYDKFYYEIFSKLKINEDQ